MDEQQTTKEEETEATTQNTEEGDKPESTAILERVVKENERMEDNIKRQEEIIRRQEEVAAKQILAGRAEAGSQPPKEKKLTDTEYAEALQRGEVNPLKEDGFVR